MKRSTFLMTIILVLLFIITGCSKNSEATESQVGGDVNTDQLLNWIAWLYSENEESMVDVNDDPP